MFLKPGNNDKSDEALLEGYRKTRDLETLSALYLRYTGMVYGVCLKYLRDREASKDAVMQIHEKLIKSLLEHDVSNFRSWLYVNARNYCLMQLRAAKGRQTEEISPFLMESGTGEHPEDDLLGEQKLQRLEKCIETLAEAQQQCVRLFYLQEKCYREVSEETGFDALQVKSYIQNGKRNLKICMEANGGS